MKDLWNNIKFFFGVAAIVVFLVCIVAFGILSIIAKLHFAFKFW